MSDDDRELEAWLRRMQWALASLPEQERDDIVAETRAHISEARAQGMSLQEALAGFGNAEDYASSFVEERVLVQAVGSQKWSAMFNVIVRRAHRSLIAATAFFLVIVLVLATAVVVLTAVIRIEDPAHAGLWLGQRQFFIGIIDDPGQSRELLGAWIYPFAALFAGVTWIAARRVLVWSVKRLARLKG